MCNLDNWLPMLCLDLAKVALSVGWRVVAPLRQGVLEGMERVRVGFPMPEVEAFHCLPHLRTPPMHQCINYRRLASPLSQWIGPAQHFAQCGAALRQLLRFRKRLFSGGLRAAPAAVLLSYKCSVNLFRSFRVVHLAPLCSYVGVIAGKELFPQAYLMRGLVGVRLMVV